MSFTTKTTIIDGQEIQVKVYPLGVKSRKRRIKPDLEDEMDMQQIHKPVKSELPEHLRHLVDD